MWDGLMYCRSCVERADPFLLDTALRHRDIRERAPFRFANEFGLSMALVVNAVGLFFCAFIAFCGLAVGKLLQVLPLCELFAVISIALSVFWGIAAALAFHLARRTAVMVRNGLIVATLPFFAVCALTECRWRMGRLWETLGPHKYLARLNRQPVIILILPRTSISRLPKGESEWLIPVGCNQKTQRLWKAFLALTGVPEDHVPTND